MRKTAAIAALALMLVTGCSAAAEEAKPTAAAAAASATAKPSATPAPSAQDSIEESCGKLLGTDGKGALSQAGYVVRISGGTYSFQGPAESARALNEQLRFIARTTPEEMDAQLNVLLSSMGKAIQMIENPGPGSAFDMFAWQDAIADLQGTCAPYAAS